MTTSGAAGVTTRQGAAVTSSGQTGHDVMSGHWVAFGHCTSSVVTLGRIGQVDSTLGGAVVKVATSTVFGAQVTLDGASEV